MILCDLPYVETGNSGQGFRPKIFYFQIQEIIRRWLYCSKWNFKFGLALYIAPIYINMIGFGKRHGTNAPNVNYQPFRIHEFVFIFGKGRVTNGTRTAMRYNPQKTAGTPYCQKSGKISENWKGGLKNIVTDNLSGLRHPKTIQKFNREKGYHPTQKPVEMCEYLINTYTDAGDIVLDNCMGSGSTGVACVNTKRNFIGIELDNTYFEIAKKRIGDKVND